MKRELLAAEWAAEQQQACRAVELTVMANGPPHTRANGYPLPWDIKAEGDLLIPCPKERVKFIRMRNKQMAALRAAAWEEQVREGRFVRLHVCPSHAYRHILEWKRSRGGRLVRRPQLANSCAHSGVRQQRKCCPQQLGSG